MQMFDDYPLAVLIGSDNYVVVEHVAHGEVQISHDLPHPIRVSIWNKRPVGRAMEPVLTSTYTIP